MFLHRAVHLPGGSGECSERGCTCGGAGRRACISAGGRLLLGPRVPRSRLPRHVALPRGAPHSPVHPSGGDALLVALPLNCAEALWQACGVSTMSLQSSATGTFVDLVDGCECDSGLVLSVACVVRPLIHRHCHDFRRMFDSWNDGCMTPGAVRNVAPILDGSPPYRQCGVGAIRPLGAPPILR